MAVFRVSYTRPIPPDAQRFEKKVRQGKAFVMAPYVRFKGRSGIVEAPIAQGGKEGRYRVEARVWSIRYRDENDIVRVEGGFETKEQGKAVEAIRKQQVADVKAGVRTRADFARAIEAGKGIESHLLRFEEKLHWHHNGSRHNPPEYIRKTMFRVRKLLQVMAVAALGELTRERIETGLRRLQAEGDLAAKTRNDYRAAIAELCRWAVAESIIPGNVCDGIGTLNTQLDTRHPRREWTGDDANRLIGAARASTRRVRKYDGETRARIYTMAFATGLRRRELGLICWGDFLLGGEKPVLVVPATTGKAKRVDEVALHLDLVPLLQSWFSHLRPEDRLFPGLEKTDTHILVKADLKAAGIAYRDHNGFLDFHSARHGFVSNLFAAGASPTEVKALARHADIATTMKYTHTHLHHQHAALAKVKLPLGVVEPQPAPLAKTGPDTGASSCTLLALDTAIDCSKTAGTGRAPTGTDGHDTRRKP